MIRPLQAGNWLRKSLGLWVPWRSIILTPHPPSHTHTWLIYCQGSSQISCELKQYIPRSSGTDHTMCFGTVPWSRTVLTVIGHYSCLQSSVTEMLHILLNDLKVEESEPLRQHTAENQKSTLWHGLINHIIVCLISEEKNGYSALFSRNSLTQMFILVRGSTRVSQVKLT